MNASPTKEIVLGAGADFQVGSSAQSQRSSKASLHRSFKSDVTGEKAFIATSRSSDGRGWTAGFGQAVGDVFDVDDGLSASDILGGEVLGSQEEERLIMRAVRKQRFLLRNYVDVNSSRGSLPDQDRWGMSIVPGSAMTQVPAPDGLHLPELSKAKTKEFRMNLTRLVAREASREATITTLQRSARRR